jgi:hypothetical protein
MLFKTATVQTSSEKPSSTWAKHNSSVRLVWNTPMSSVYTRDSIESDRWKENVRVYVRTRVYVCLCICVCVCVSVRISNSTYTERERVVPVHILQQVMIPQAGDCFRLEVRSQTDFQRYACIEHSFMRRGRIRLCTTARKHAQEIATYAVNHLLARSTM